MRNLGGVALILGALFALVAVYIVFANPDLNAPISSLPAPTWVPFYDLLGWRLVLGGWAIVGSVLLAVGSIATRGYPRIAFLSLLVYVLLALVMVGALVLAPSFALAFFALIFDLVVVPLIAVLIAAGITRAARNRGAALPAG